MHGVIDYAGFVNGYVLPTMGMVLMAVAGVVIAWGRKKADAYFAAHNMAAMATVDGRAADAIMNALQNGANAAIGKAKLLAPQEKVTISNDLVAQTAQHVLDSVPDALTHHGVTPEKLQTLATAAVQKALGP